MKDEKTIKKRILAERMLDEIGLIDDRFIAEAESPYRRRSSATIRRLVIVGVAAALSLSMLVGAFAVGMLVDRFTGSSMDEAPNSGDVADEGESVIVPEGSEPSVLTLDDRLLSIRAKTEGYKVESLDLFDGVARIVWRYADETEYRACALSDRETRVLHSKLSKKSERRINTDEARQYADLWICYGDGRVLSPYLDLTAGNIGYGEIFEYEPEYEPTEEFSDYLCDLIS